ncbi:DUF7544 domain-containing protein [Halalkalicoccus subterraneus]|uniref:DUF7544 domain-containing protein n=1 Tax=Halalkalicoccus subterraneus TaxID=2675002 RepID=UPI000EFD9E03|nr:hypothetical protein [Halalkalicoccus subterraneus]
MAWYALRAAGESVRATRVLLASASLAAWGRLAVLVPFVGTLVTPFLTDFNRGPSPVALVASATAPGLLTAALVAALALFVGAVFEFVFLDALRGRQIRLRSESRRHLRSGLELFALRVALAVPVGLALVAPIVIEGWLALLLPLAVVISALALDRLTVAFVVPIALVEACSLREAWRAFARTLRAAWHEYAAYLLVAATLWVAIALVGGLLGGLVAVALLVPFGILGVTIDAALSAQGLSGALVGRTVLTTLSIPYVLALLAAVSLVHVPLVTYLRYVALFVLGDVDERHDPIPRLRASIRRGTGTGRPGQ